MPFSMIFSVQEMSSSHLFQLEHCFILCVCVCSIFYESKKKSEVTRHVVMGKLSGNYI